MADRPDAVTPHPVSLTCGDETPRDDGKSWPFEDHWRTEAVLGLARGIRVDQAFDRMPILADALEEAGCDNALVLHHCRVCQEHQAGCWVIRAVLDMGPPQPAPPPPVQGAIRFGRILEGLRKEMRILPTAAEVRADGPDTRERAIARWIIVGTIIGAHCLVGLVMWLCRGK